MRYQYNISGLPADAKLILVSEDPNNQKNLGSFFPTNPLKYFYSADQVQIPAEPGQKITYKF